jgi:uncharacterized protein YndB with AHSA1/START domain
MTENLTPGVIEKTVLIQADPAVIFRALTESKDLAQWFCDRASSEPRIGGELKAFWRTGGGGQALRGRAVFTRLVPDAQVELDWVDEGGGEITESGRHTISYAIRWKRGSSEVIMRDAGPPLTDDETLEVLGRGWMSVLRDLKDHCETKQRSSRRHAANEVEFE